MIRPRRKPFQRIRSKFHKADRADGEESAVVCVPGRICCGGRESFPAGTQAERALSMTGKLLINDREASRTKVNRLNPAIGDSSRRRLQPIVTVGRAVTGREEYKAWCLSVTLAERTE